MVLKYKGAILVQNFK